MNKLEWTGRTCFIVSRSLDQHLNHLLNDAVKLLSDYQEDLLQEWGLMLNSLKNTNKKSVRCAWLRDLYILDKTTDREEKKK